MMIGIKKQENIMVLKDKLTPEQRVLDEFKKRIKKTSMGLYARVASYNTLKEILTANTTEDGSLTIPSGAGHPTTEDEVVKHGCIVPSGEYCEFQVPNTDPEDECTGCGKPFQHYAHKLCPACWGKAHTEAEDEAFEKEFQDWERVKKHIALLKIEEFTEATRERYEQVDEIPLLDEFGDWLQHEDK